MTATETDTKRAPGGRSPAYPFIPLEKALSRADELRKAVGRNDTRVISAVHHWGYGPKSSGGIQTIAALKHFGLLSDEGSGDSRRVKLTDMALRILLDERPNSTDRRLLIQKAALTPKMHHELWSRWASDLPVDAELRHYLILDRDFNENGADDLIAEYKTTLSYAGLLDSDTVSPDESDKIDDEPSVQGGHMQQPQSPAQQPEAEPSPAASLVLYDDRIRINADVDLQGAKDLLVKLQKRVDLLEEEVGKPN